MLSFIFAASLAWLLVPASEAIARRLGAIDEPRARSLHCVPTPRLGGLAILVGVLVSGVIWLPWNGQTKAILAGAAAITALGAIDDIYELGAGPKLAGQFAASTIPVLAGVRVESLNFLGIAVPALGWAAYPLTVLGIVAIINMINFIDGVDGLASGVCAIAAMAFAVIALSLDRGPAGVLAALTAGASLGFLRYGFPPASSFMGDTGSNLLGYLLAVIAVQGALKTNAVVALALPLLVLAVPIFDASFVVAKRIKYRLPIYRADRSHFHHRMANIGFSQRRTLAYLYGWTLILAGLALALRFIPYYLHGRWHPVWAAVLAICGLIALAASVYLVYVLEILKLRRVRFSNVLGLRTAAGRPGPSLEAIDKAVAEELETGSFPTIDPETGEFETVEG